MLQYGLHPSPSCHLIRKEGRLKTQRNLWRLNKTKHWGVCERDFFVKVSEVGTWKLSLRTVQERKTEAAKWCYQNNITCRIWGFHSGVVMKSIIFWDMTPCSSLSCTRRFGGTSGATQRTTQCHIPEDDTLNNITCSFNLGSQIFVIICYTTWFHF
jgi:hypothetical protein